MGKIKWGAADTPADVAALIDEASEGFDEYTGPKPPKGVYRFKITRLLKSESSGGFDQMEVFLTLDPDDPTHKKYAGFFMRDWVIVAPQTMFRVKPFLAAIGVTAKQFATMTVTEGEPDDDGRETIIKMGPKKFPGVYVYGSIKPSRRDDDYFDIRYLPGPPEDSDDDAGDDDAGDDEPPF